VTGARRSLRAVRPHCASLSQVSSLRAALSAEESNRTAVEESKSHFQKMAQELQKCVAAALASSAHAVPHKAHTTYSRVAALGDGVARRCMACLSCWVMVSTMRLQKCRGADASPGVVGGSAG
jgi:hypothetical protein